MSAAEERCRQRLAEGWCAAVPLWWHRERDAILLMAEDEAEHMRQVPTWEGRGW